MFDIEVLAGVLVLGFAWYWQASDKARMIRMIILGALGALGPQGAQGAPRGPKGPQVHCDGSAQKMNPPQKIALFGKMAPRGPPWAPENGAPWAPWAPQGPRPPRAPWGVVILATRMIILTTRMIILMLYQRPAYYQSLCGHVRNIPHPCVAM